MKYILLILLFCSCTLVRTVNVSDYNKQMNQNIQTAEKGIKAVDLDLQEHHLISQKWSDKESNRREMKLTQIQQNIKQYYYRLKEDFASSKFQNTRKLTSKDKEYGEFTKSAEGFDERLEALNAQFKNYKKESDALNDYLATKKIYRVDQKKLNQDFLKALNESKKAQKQVKNDLIDYNQKASKDEKGLIQDLVKMVEKMENETFKLQRLYTSTMNELKSGVKYVTPGMKAHDYMGKIKAIEKTINEQVEAFNLRASGLKH